MVELRLRLGGAHRAGEARLARRADGPFPLVPGDEHDLIPLPEG
jgi:hypothetical protein